MVSSRHAPAVLIAVAALSLLAGPGCSGPSSRVKSRESKRYRNALVLPVVNQSNDLTAPVLVRHFLEKKIAGKGFTLVRKGKAVDNHLRQMGLGNPAGFSAATLQSVGQSVGAAVIFRCTLLEYSQDFSREQTVIRARFEAVDTLNGDTVWVQDEEVRKGGLSKVPVQGVPSDQWTDERIKSVSNSQAGKLPRELVSGALGSLKIPH